MSERLCSRCKQPAGQFRSKNRQMCVPCHRAYHAEYYRKNKAILGQKVRGHYLRARYGMSEDDFQAMVRRQNGRCAICGELPTSGRHGGLNIDHCHKGGSVRGLLCWDCNSAMGKFDDDPEMLERAIAYLRAGAVHPKCGGGNV